MPCVVLPKSWRRPVGSQEQHTQLQAFRALLELQTHDSFFFFPLQAFLGSHREQIYSLKWNTSSIPLNNTLQYHMILVFLSLTYFNQYDDFLVHPCCVIMALFHSFYDWVIYHHWRRKWQPTPLFLPGESQGWGSLVGSHLWGCTELDTTEAT